MAGAHASGIDTSQGGGGWAHQERVGATRTDGEAASQQTKWVSKIKQHVFLACLSDVARAAHRARKRVPAATLIGSEFA